jgi:hypothetical protein
MKNYEKIISNKKKDISEIEFSNCGTPVVKGANSQISEIGISLI